MNVLSDNSCWLFLIWIQQTSIRPLKHCYLCARQAAIFFSFYNSGHHLTSPVENMNEQMWRCHSQWQWFITLPPEAGFDLGVNSGYDSYMPSPFKANFTTTQTCSGRKTVIQGKPKESASRPQVHLLISMQCSTIQEMHDLMRKVSHTKDWRMGSVPWPLPSATHFSVCGWCWYSVDVLVQTLHVTSRHM